MSGEPGDDRGTSAGPSGATAADRLAGVRALVSGAGSGIGRASALRLASEGAAVVATDIRVELAEETARLIIDQGGVASVRFCDVADEASVRDATAEAAGVLGGLDTLVACAGIASRGVTHELSLHDWDLVLRVNLTGVFLSCKHALPHIVDAGGGSVVTIGSVSSVVIGGGGSAASYKAAKGGVLQLTKQVAVDYAASNVRANCVCPGAVDTNIGHHGRELAPRLTTVETVPPTRVQLVPPMPRRADPSEVASVVAFLASRDSSFMTGSAVMVDGGLTAI